LDANRRWAEMDGKEGKPMSHPHYTTRRSRFGSAKRHLGGHGNWDMIRYDSPQVFGRYNEGKLLTKSKSLAKELNQNARMTAKGRAEELKGKPQTILRKHEDNF